VRGVVWSASLNILAAGPEAAVLVTTISAIIAPQWEQTSRFDQSRTTRTSDQAGDGTTTATVLAQAIVREGLSRA
jgi:hypothetical protein